jgi:TrmH family RNA methyltransferase
MISKATIRLIASLEHKKNREAHRLFVAEGDKLVADLRRHLRPQAVFALAPAAASGDTPVSEAEMGRISQLKTPSPVLALFPLPQPASPPQPSPRELVLALDNVQDPGNLGALIRLCCWFGVDWLVCSPHTADCYSPKVVQASMGAVAHVRVCYLDLPSFLRDAQSRGLPTYGAFMQGDTLYETPLSVGGVVVMGSEGQGISPQVAQHLDRRLCIPAFAPARGCIESLNVTTAAAIICAEFRRRGEGSELRTTCVPVI